MSYVESWTLGYNTTPTDQTTLVNQMASFCLQLKNFLVAGGWSVVQSCNTTSFATNGTDYWSTIADITFAATTSNHSWIVLKSPEGMVAGLDGSYTGDQSRLWFSIDCNYANTAAQAKFYFHRANPTIGTAATNLCPTSTYQWGWATQQFLRTTHAATARFHFLRTAKGAFMAFVGYASVGYLPFSLSLLPVTAVKRNAANTLDYPFALVGFCKWYDADYGALYNYKVAETTNSTTTNRGPWGYGLLGWAYDGTVASLQLGTVSYFNQNYSNITGIGFATYPWPGMIGEAFPSTGDAWGGAKRIDGDVPVICTTTNKTAAIGILSDITCSGLPVSQSSVNDDADVRYAYVGSYWLPANVAPTL
jgi:hypothetical protein